MRKNDSLEAVEADLRALPPLKAWAVPVYLYGGWNPYGEPPMRVEVVTEQTIMGSRRRMQDRESLSGVKIEVSSAEATLFQIRAMARGRVVVRRSIRDDDPHAAEGDYVAPEPTRHRARVRQVLGEGRDPTE